ncbi:MAG: type 1 glutamine amidotransferase domain-containing protein [Xanthomonadaceae bacterium]|nr:type 1 glutamine amidotransferase domain-containing protein [Xanthomonadaceae bacterium]
MKRMILGLSITLAAFAASAEKNERKTNMNKRALIVVTSHHELGETERKTGWYLSEVTHVYYPLNEAGFEVDFASPQGGAAPLDEKSLKLDDPANKKFIEDKKIAQMIQNTIPLSKVDAKKYQVIHFAGGHGTMWDFPDNEPLQRITAQIYERGGIVSAVCHGPAALVNVKLSNGEYLVKGKEINSFTNEEESEVGLTKIVPFPLESKLKERGGKFHAGNNWADMVVVSGRLVTGQNPQSAHSVGKKVIELTKSINNH